MSNTPDTKPDQKPDDTKPDAKPDAKPTQQGDPADGDKPLGPNGEKALEAERAARKAAEKAAADVQAKLDQISRANETELQRVQREAKEALDLANKATTEALRLRIAAKHGITDEDADLFLTGSDRDQLEAQAKRLAERTSNAPKPDRSQGGSNGDLPLNSDPLLADLKAKLGIA